MDKQESVDLLNATHDFPCPITIKVIGESADGFVGRVVAAIRDELDFEVDPPFKTRETKKGRHVAVTLDPHMETAYDVLAVYERLRDVRGVVMTM